VAAKMRGIVGQVGPRGLFPYLDTTSRLTNGAHDVTFFTPPPIELC
jgi:hypothetical protein